MGCRTYVLDGVNVRHGMCGDLGFSPEHRIGADGAAFIAFAPRFMRAFGSVVGGPLALIDLCVRRQIKYLRGIHIARRMFGRQGPQLPA